MTLRERLSGIAACLSIFTLLAGMPAVLIGVGVNPVPDHLPTFHGLVALLTTPDDGTAALAALGYAGWLLWIVLALMLLAEMTAQLRGVQTPDVPGLHLPQLAVRQLVAAAAALFLAAPLVLAHSTPSVAAPRGAAAPQDARTAASGLDHRAPTEGRTHAHRSAEHLVRPGDTLSGLAERYLDDAHRWREIYDATQSVRQPDGGQLTDPDLIVDGWTVRVPHPGADANDPGRPVTERHVRQGDTLSVLAETQLGKANRWPEIYRASEHVRQPGGAHLQDPDLIRPGWTLRIPKSSTSGSKPSTTTKHDPPPRQPAPHDHQEPGASHAAEPTPAAPPAPTSSPTTAATGGAPSPAGEADRSAPTDVPEPTVTAPTAGLEAPWILSGLAVGGVVLAGSAYLTLRRRREQQMRMRAPGSTVSQPEPAIRPVEKTIVAVGSVSADAVRAMDQRLRELASTHLASGQPMPQVETVELTDQRIVLHLREAADLSEPWTKGSDQRTWSTPHTIAYTGGSVEQPAPYPLLVTFGTADDGHIWLLNLEGLGVIDVIGDRTYGDDLLRYVGAELAVNPWSRDVAVDCVGVATEIAPMNVERIRTFESAEAAANEMRLEAETTIARVGAVGASTVSARVAQLADEAWPAQVLLLDGELADDPSMTDLLDLISAHSERSATVVLVAADGTAAAPDHHLVRVDARGRLTIPHLDSDLNSVGLTPDEAEGCALLLGQADTVVDSTVPESLPTEEEDEVEAAPAADDDDELRGGPTTGGALEPHRVSTLTHVDPAPKFSDPELDADLAAWLAESCDRPRLTLLGPVRVRANGRAIPKRKPYYTELLAYLALRENGARPEEVAEAFGLALPSVRTSIKTVRDWLGVNPRTGERHLPEATRSRAAIARGVAVYQVDDLLVDVDLFERLRRRAGRREPDGTEDLCMALSLVTGRPFDQLRPGGWSWLVDMNVDNAMVCAVVDVAHDLVEQFLALDEPARARAAAEAALLAAPTDPIPKLDLAAVAHHQGHRQEARRIALEVVRDAEVDGLPTDLGRHIGAQVQHLIDQGEPIAGKVAS